MLRSTGKYSKPYNKKCLCNILCVMLYWCRLFGLTPITWSHSNNRTFIKEDGQCIFRKSRIWIAYSILTAIVYNILLYWSLDFTYTSNARILFIVHECVYHTFSTLLIIFGILNSERLIKTLNGIAPILQRGLMCQSSKRILQKWSSRTITIILIQLLMQYGLLIFIVSNYRLEFRVGYLDFIGIIIQNIPFMFYYLFCTICSMYVSIFMCFETAMCQTLSKGLLRPTDRDKLGIMRHAGCNGSHVNVLSSRNGSFIENLDGLRRLHEEIRQSLFTANKAFNPQISIHVFIEIGLLVMHWYAVVMFFQTEYKSAEIYVYHIIDVLFVSLHMIGFIMFLSASEALKTSQHTLLQYLLDLTYKHFSAEEFAHIRLFGMKLIFTPAQFIAGRFFYIDIKLVASISGYVGTYLLIALQFKLPKTPISDMQQQNQSVSNRI